jgi:hypothetical protein
MRRWGIIITGFYAAAVFAFLLPGFLVLIRLPLERGEGFDWWRIYSEIDGGGWIAVAIWTLILIGGQALLLGLSVDTSWRHVKPRRHIAVSAALTGLFTTLLVVSAIFCLMVLFHGDDAFEFEWLGIPAGAWVLFSWPVMWFAWGIVFYRYCRGGSVTLERAISWLLKGSILELLIAIPAHVVVRSRGDCSAPGFTSWGIVTGLAVMLMCFGPGVLALYKKRIDSYGPGNAGGTSS